MERGITQKALAAQVKGSLDYTYIGKIERGEQLPSLKILIKISEALAVEVGYFFQDETVKAAREIFNSDFGRFIKDDKGRELVHALQLLDKEDIPLIVEIIRVLSRHRKAASKTASDAAEEGCLMAAEEEALYEKK